MLPDLAGTPVFDEKLALELLEGDRELLMDVLELYRETVADLISNLKTAVTAVDSEEVSRVAHSIKGASANICAQRIHALCSILEDDSREGKTENLQELYEAIAEQIQIFTSETEGVT